METGFSRQEMLGVAITLTLRWFNFGGGNHTVYLIAPLQ